MNEVSVAAPSTSVDESGMFQLGNQLSYLWRHNPGTGT